MTRILRSCLVFKQRDPVRWKPLRFVSIAVLLYAASNVCALSQSLVIRHVTVIDAAGHAPQGDMTVVVERDRIISVEPSNKVHLPKESVTVDGYGKFLIPGLWDMHVHGASDERAPWSHLLFIANGVVGVRDMSGPPDARAWRAAQSSHTDPSPTIYLGSPIVDGPNPVWSDSLVAENAEQGRTIVDQQHERGADFIKVYSRLPRNVYFAIADEANRRNIPFEGHVPESVTAVEASGAGQKSIEHLTRVANACSKEEAAIDSQLQAQNASFRTPGLTLAQKVDIGKQIIRLDTQVIDTFDHAKAEALLATFLKNGTWQCPTLIQLRAQIEEPLPPHDQQLQYLSSEIRARWNDGYYLGVPPKPRAALIDLSRRQFEESMKIVSLMYRAGVLLLAGTDTMNPGCYPGFGIHDELALLVDAGLLPMAALETATRNAALFMGQLNRRGTIEVGKIADLVLLDRDPLVDIRNTRSIQAVVLKGKLYSRSDLDAMLAKARVLASRQQAVQKK
jgi:imidazolonepropionase-like amidohydrolase